jgi:hypothetical protein
MTSVTSALTDQTSAHAAAILEPMGGAADRGPFTDLGPCPGIHDGFAATQSVSRRTLPRQLNRCPATPRSLRRSLPGRRQLGLAPPKLPLAYIELVELAEPGPLDGPIQLSMHVLLPILGAQNVEAERLVAIPNWTSPPLDAERLGP